MPPFPTATVPVTLAAVPETLPVMLATMFCRVVNTPETVRFVVEALIAARFVVVALVVVEFLAVKFCRVVEPMTNISPR